MFSELGIGFRLELLSGGGGWCDLVNRWWWWVVLLGCSTVAMGGLGFGFEFGFGYWLLFGY